MSTAIFPRMSAGLILLICSTALLGCGGSYLPPPRTLPDDEEEAGGQAATSSQRNTADSSSSSSGDSASGGASNGSSKTAADGSSGSERRPLPTPKSPEELAAQRKRRDRQNLSQLADALMAYVRERGQFPYKRGDHPWRIELLPYLGEQKIFDQYVAGKARNKLPAPEVYINPHDGHDSKDVAECRYIAVGGYITSRKRGCFGDDHPIRPQDITDGLENTLALVVYATPTRWTSSPIVDVDSISLSYVDTYMGDTFLAVLASGDLVELSADIPSGTLRSACTINGGENVDLHAYAHSINGERVARTGSSSGGDSNVASSGSDLPSDDSRAGDRSQPLATDNGNRTANQDHPRFPPRRVDEPAGGPSRSNLHPIPSDSQQKVAMRLVKELFLDRYQDADNRKEKEEIAREMLAKSKQLGEDVAGKYVMLTTAQRIALEVDDIETADKALDELLELFDLDAYQMKVDLLKKTSRLSKKNSFDTRVMDESWEIVHEAISRDDYATAREMAEVALAAARRLNDKDEASKISRGLFELDKMEASYKKVREALEQVGDASEDPRISEQVGRYYCFMKDEWDKGLPHLARAEDPDLRRLAQRDLESPVDPQAQLELADGWWEQSQEVRSPEDERIVRRALMWYEAAKKNLPEGLPRLKADLRIKEINQELDS